MFLSSLVLVMGRQRRERTRTAVDGRTSYFEGCDLADRQSVRCAIYRAADIFLYAGEYATTIHTVPTKHDTCGKMRSLRETTRALSLYRIPVFASVRQLIAFVGRERRLCA